MKNKPCDPWRWPYEVRIEQDNITHSFFAVDVTSNEETLKALTHRKTEALSSHPEKRTERTLELLLATKPHMQQQ